MSEPNQSSTHRLRSNHGIVELTTTSERVRNNDGSASEIYHWSVRMSRDQSSPAPTMDQAGMSPSAQELVNQSASWLRFEGNLNGLEPRTVVIAGNQTDGGTYTARWHGSDRPGSGQLTEFLVPTYKGLEPVPPEVLSQIPQDRLTDVIRPGGTRLDLIPPQDGSDARWVASYLDGQNRRIDLSFADNNELAIRRVHSNRPGEGAITTYGPGNDNLPRREDALVVPNGGRVIEENATITRTIPVINSDGSVTNRQIQEVDPTITVINQAGDVRTQWIQNQDGGYTQLRQIEHLEVNGQPSAWRVSQDTTDNTATLYRVDANNQIVGRPVGLSIGSDNSLIIPRTGDTDALDVASLRMPSGREIGIVAPTVERSDPGITTRELPLTANSTRFSQRESTEEKAGYDDPAQAPWRQRQVELPRSIAEQLNIPVPAGQNQVTAELEVLQHQSATGRYSLRDGTELYANPAGDRLVVGNANIQTRDDAKVQVTEFDDSFLVPSNGRPAHQVLRELADRGLEPVAVLGTGFITPDPGENGTRVIGYHYTNFARLEEGEEGRRNQPVTELRDPNNGTNLRAGYLVRSNGEMELVNIDRQRFPTPDTANAELERLKNDPTVAAIHLFTHQVARQPGDLIGNPPYDPDRGDRGWTPRPPGVTDGQYDDDKSNNLESRSFLAFDENGRFLSRVSTPPIAMRDTLSLAQEMYGPNVQVLNGDGDFYARAWYLDGRGASDPLALGYENAMILVRPTPDGQPAQLREFTDSERSAIRDYDSQEGFWDNLRDIWKGIQRRFSDSGEAPAVAGLPETTSTQPAQTTPSIVEDRRFGDILASVNQNPQLSGFSDTQRANLSGVLTLDADSKKLTEQSLVVAVNDQRTYAFALDPSRPESGQYAKAELATAIEQPLAQTDRTYREQQALAAQTQQQEANVRTEEQQRGGQRLA